MTTPPTHVDRSGPTNRTAVAVLAALAYLPILATSPGRVSADTKSYLTIDPGRLLGRAWSMWDPYVGAGTVTHQTIGYLFPLGPLYRSAEVLGSPDWVTQRLIWGSIVFAAALGAFRLARWIGWAVVPAFVVAIAYGWSPYLLSYLARLSVILLPWAALGWLVLFAARSVREGGWRTPARFALVIAVIGSVNATSLVLVGLGPVVWVAAEWWGGRVHTRAVLGATARTAVLTIAVSLWWLAALRVQGTYGIPILRYTETYEAVAGASTPPELLRGLGYWFFYGGDRIGPWVGPSARYVHPLVILLGAALVGLALFGLTRQFRGRRRSLSMVVIGLAVSAGAAPLAAPTPYGRFFEWFATSTTAGFALRSTPRAAPVLLLGLAFGIGAATTAGSAWLAERRSARRHAEFAPWRRTAIGHAVPAVVVVALLAQLHPWFVGAALTPSILRDEHLPPHRTELASWLDAGGSSRVYELPGADFASHRWGGTVDPPLPGMTDRPYLARELVPQGGPGTADLLGAFERRLHEGWFEPDSLTPIADRLGVGTIVVRNDLEHERYRLARPTSLWPRLLRTLGPPDHAGPVVADRPVIPMVDEQALADPDAVAEFPVVAAWDLDPDRPLWSASAASPMIVAGSGDGLVDLAAAGLLDHDRPVRYAASPETVGAAAEWIGADPWLVVTDTNRRRGHRWSTLGANRGALEQAGSDPLRADPGDNRLEVLPDHDRHRTVLDLVGDVAAVRATGYGNRIAYTPEDAPVFALDGDPTTAWRTGVFDDVRGERIEVELREPIVVDHVELLQPITGVTDRYVTRVRIDLDDHTSFTVDLDERSRRLPGQRVDVTAPPFRTIAVEILADDRGPLSSYAGQPGVGLAELRLPGVSMVAEAVLPTAWMTEIADHERRRLDVVMTRERIDPATPNRTDPEPHLARRFDLPAARTFEVSGTVRLSSAATDDLLAATLGESAVARADRRLPGAPGAGAVAAVDDDPDTAWSTPFDDVIGARLEVRLDEPAEIGAVELTWIDDAHHSTPTVVRISTESGELVSDVVVTGPGTGRVDLGATSPTGWFAIELVGTTEPTTPEYFSGIGRQLPTALVEVTAIGPAGRPVRPAVPPGDTPLPSTCRTDLVAIDGRPVAVRLTGTRADALARRPIAITGCDPIELSSGTRRLRAAPGGSTGVDVDRVVLTSAGADASSNAADPDVTAVRVGPTGFDVTLGPSTGPTTLVLRESWNPGWTLTVDGTDAGPPILVDGYANAWILPASGTSRQIDARWTPQRSVRTATIISLLAGLAVLAIGLGRIRAVGIDPVGRPRPGRRRAGSAAVALTGVLAVVGGAPAVLGLVGAWWLRRRGSSLAGVLPLALWAPVALWVIGWQVRYGFPPDPDWPSRFGVVAPLTWAAVGATAGSRGLDHPITDSRPVAQ